MSDFTRLPDLAARALGGGVVAAKPRVSMVSVIALRRYFVTKTK
ncbi:hypothetical protein [Streptomyces iranensis]|uniref:Uncharacterized protein n=1 Tax=Streptomyces iranensis TaxID=576784 RepID=A0A060ZJW3_9ACTN|nr:hypothetical protein [Streptomyces iranensis]MBP2063408.1 hypothetical protein [Streptomyces iranensis]CDR01550.1 predicted protein [Streptomyces iranensis]